MTSIFSLELPKPKNWQDFESMVLDAQRERWKSTTLQKNGRSGQSQQGVDIWGPDDLGRRTGIQCKKYEKKITMKIIEDEVNNAKDFKPTLTTLYIATTNDYDTKLQQQVRLYSDKRVAQGDFAVSIIFWEDVISGLALNPNVFQLHYPLIHLRQTSLIDRSRFLAALELGYYGPYIWEYLLLTLGEFGQMANADPEDLTVIMSIVEQRSKQLLTEKEASPIIISLEKVKEIVDDPSKHTDEGWAAAEFYCKRIATRMLALGSLYVQESNVLEVGRTLGAIHHHSDGEVSVETSNNIKKRLCAILPEKSHSSIISKIESANNMSYPYGYRWAPTIYNYFEREVRFGDLH